MVNKIKDVLKKALEKIKPSEKEISEIKKSLGLFLKKIESNKKKLGTDAEIFIGGSFAKKTMIKKDSYDIDVFIRFDRRYSRNRLSEITEKMLQGMGAEKIHGSRDYFKIKSGKNLFFEIVPVKKIKNSKEAENVTDLSYSHVNYIRKKLGSKTNEVLLAKAFCHANDCYGAESHIRGFSGYGLELLIHKYKTFIEFLKAMLKINPGKKLVIDIEKHHKGRQRILMDLNEAKLQSPVILVDPTFRQRNILAALSEETFFGFQKVAKAFLRNPSINFFVSTSLDAGKLKSRARKSGYESIVIEVKTNKQEGSVAGSKLLKFFRLFEGEISRFFDIKDKGFEYNNQKNATYFIAAKNKNRILVKGPHISHKKHTIRFKARHKKVFIKDGRLHSIIKNKIGLKKFINDWKSNKANRKKMKDMYITDMKILD